MVAPRQIVRRDLEEFAAAALIEGQGFSLQAIGQERPRRRLRPFGQRRFQVRDRLRQCLDLKRRMSKVEISAANAHLHVERRPRPAIEQFGHFGGKLFA
jgi:hypothetical protein